MEEAQGTQTIQSPCLTEVTQVCPHRCCPSPLFNSPEPLHKTSKPRSSSADWRRDFVARTSSCIFPNTQFTNHESLPSLQKCFSEFLKAYPQYADNFQIDQIRAKEYYHLSLSSHVCLDYIGIGLFSYSQLQNQESLNYQTASSSSPSRILDIPFFSVSYKMGNLKTHLLHGGAESKLESAMKKKIMNFLNFSENEYSMVFTANRTSAFKLLAESYPFQSSRKLLTVYDCESEAVEAIINTSEKKGARVMSAEFSWPRLRIQSAKLKKMVVSRKKEKKGLFVFPLHSRVTGARYPYLWLRIAQENGWHILIDACALGPKDMNSFGLSLFRPDFLICSFYKIFGENPSGFGCLIVKKSTLPILEGEPSSGMVTLLPAKITLEPEIEAKPTAIEAFKASENRVVENIEIECRGLDQVDSLGLTKISRRARCLINWLVNALSKLQHPNTDGVALVKIYGPKIKFDRGPALAFNVFDWKGQKVEPVLVQKLADRRNISLSHGKLHNIWFSEKYQREKDKAFDTVGMAESKKKDKKVPGISVVTTSLGFLANFEDAYRLWAFVSQFLDADFVEKARWRYTALNQKKVEV